MCERRGNGRFFCTDRQRFNNGRVIARHETAETAIGEYEIKGNRHKPKRTLSRPHCTVVDAPTVVWPAGFYVRHETSDIRLSDIVVDRVFFSVYTFVEVQSTIRLESE